MNATAQTTSALITDENSSKPVFTDFITFPSQFVEAQLSSEEYTVYFWIYIYLSEKKQIWMGRQLLTDNKKNRIGFYGWKVGEVNKELILQIVSAIRRNPTETRQMFATIQTMRRAGAIKYAGQILNYFNITV